MFPNTTESVTKPDYDKEKLNIIPIYVHNFSYKHCSHCSVVLALIILEQI